MHSWENKERERDGSYRDWRFVAAVSEMWFHSHFATKGDSSLYHSAVCYFVWSRSWPKGKNVSFPSCLKEKCIILHILHVHAVCSCMNSCAYVFMQMSTSMCAHKWEAYSWLSRCQGELCVEWTGLNSYDSVWFFIGVKLNKNDRMSVFWFAFVVCLFLFISTSLCLFCFQRRAGVLFSPLFPYHIFFVVILTLAGAETKLVFDFMVDSESLWTLCSNKRLDIHLLFPVFPQWIAAIRVSAVSALLLKARGKVTVNATLLMFSLSLADLSTPAPPSVYA